VLLALFLVKGVIITFVHEPFSGHDEVMHYAYLEYVATEQRVPVIPVLSEWQEAQKAGDTYPYDMAPDKLWPYCRFTTGDWNVGCGQQSRPVRNIYWPPEDANYLSGWIYTANHPPLYYLVLTPVYWAVNDLSLDMQNYLFRLATLPFGLVTVLMAYLTARTIFPRDRFMALTVPTFVAFQPQISYEAAMLNNDAAAIAFTSVTIYLLVRGLKNGFEWGNVALIGFFFGLAALSKNTSLTMGFAIAAAMILGLGVRNIREWLPKGIFAAGIGAFLVAPWFIYMYRTYGDFTALERVSNLQYWNYANQQHPTIWSQLANKAFFWLRWRETWGEFGWRLIPLSESLLRIILWAGAVGVVGLAVWAVRLWRSGQLLPSDDEAQTARLARNADPIFACERWQVVGVLALGLTCVISYYAVLQFGVTFSLTQARYYFPAIVPGAVLLMLGYRSLIPRRLLPYGQVSLFAAMVVLNVLIYSAYVIPYWATAGRSFQRIDPFWR
jgi:4-amino-4-deoxy-L-arabinose transferase-like glycosyltransferase